MPSTTAQPTPTIRQTAADVLALVLNGEASWAFAYRWLERAAADAPDEAAAIAAEWRTF